MSNSASSPINLDVKSIPGRAASPAGQQQQLFSLNGPRKRRGCQGDRGFRCALFVRGHILGSASGPLAHVYYLRGGSLVASIHPFMDHAEELKPRKVVSSACVFICEWFLSPVLSLSQIKKFAIHLPKRHQQCMSRKIKIMASGRTQEMHRSPLCRSFLQRGAVAVWRRFFPIVSST